MLTSGHGAAASIKAQQLCLPAQDPHKIKLARIPIRGGALMAPSWADKLLATEGWEGVTLGM